MKELSLKGFGSISSGDRAAIYQYISRLEAYFLPNTQVMILLKENEEASAEKVIVELTVIEGGGHISARGYGETVLDAVKEASDLILNQFLQIQELIQKERAPIREEEKEEQNLEYKRTHWH